MNTQPPTCSVIIPTRDRRPALLSCLDALARQTHALHDGDVIICDDASSDGTTEAVRQWRGPFAPVVLRNERPQGAARARNRALAESGGEYLLYLSDDAVLDPHGVELHLSLHGRHTERKIAVSGSYRLAARWERTLFGHVLNRSEALFPYPAMLPHRLYGRQGFHAYNVSLPRAAHAACGVFDEDFRSGGEDREFGCRLEAGGYKVLYAKTCLARAGREYSVADFMEIHKERGAADALLHRKHPELPCDFASMTIRDGARLSEALNAAWPAVCKIVRLLEEVEAVYAPRSGRVREKAPWTRDGGGLLPRMVPDPQYHQSLWRRDAGEMRTYAGRLIRMLHFFRENKGDHLHQLLEGVTSCACFLRAYCETAGRAQAPPAAKPDLSD